MASYLETWEKIFSFKRTKRIFIAATRQNIGKTTISIGLMAALKKRFKKIGFIKPVGQRYLIEQGVKVDEDAVLMDRIFDFDSSLQDMSPVAIERRYTRNFLDGRMTRNPQKEIKESFKRVIQNKDAVIIEGTGHAGVGSVFDLSNAAVAKMLDSKVILICAGGIGNPIDEVMVNKSLFDNNGVTLAGVIVNKVLPGKFDSIDKYVRLGLERLGVPVLGVVPYSNILDEPTMRDIQEELDMHILSGAQYLDNTIKRTLVGAMEVKDAIKYIADGSMVITPGDRADLLSFLIKTHTGKYKSPKRLAGIILSGGMGPSRRVFSALRRTTIPTLICRFDTYDVASKVHNLSIKMKARDKNKINLVKDLIEKHIDIDRVVKSFS